jgi:hydroxyethylthiazole kinase
MTKEMLRKTAAKIAVLGEQIRQHRPLVHCITNPIAIHASANIVLAAGGRPIMAEHPQEVEEIVRTAQVLVLNLGNITDVRMSSMKKAFQEALKNRVPTVLDLVGIQCSSLRLHYAKELLEIGSPTVLKGNMSEMRKLAGLSTYGTGVDAGERDRFSEENEKEILPAFYRLSEEYRSVLLVTGQEDLIIEGPHCYCLANGDAMLGTITGTGCMLGALCGTYLTEAAESRGQAVLAAAAVMGIAGELGAENSRGPGSFQIAFLDALYNLQEEEIRNRLRLREKIKQNFE